MRDFDDAHMAAIEFVAQAVAAEAEWRRSLPAGHPGLIRPTKGHGPDMARFTCCRGLLDHGHECGCKNGEDA